MKCGCYMPGRARKIDHHSTGINGVDGEAAALKPLGDGSNILGGRSELRAELFRGKPFVKVWRGRIVLVIDERFYRRFLIHTALELKHHVIEHKTVVHLPLVVLGVGFGTRVPGERSQL